MATFGNTGIGSLNAAFTFDWKQAQQFTPASGNGALDDVKIYCSAAAIIPVKAVIYSDNAGAPDALLWTSTEQNINALGWYTFTGGALAITNGTPYWLGEIHGTANITYYYENLGGDRAYNADAYADGPADPFGAITGSTRDVSIYADYTPTGGIATGRMLKGVGLMMPRRLPKLKPFPSLFPKLNVRRL